MIVAINPLNCRITTLNRDAGRGNFVLKLMNTMELFILQEDIRTFYVTAKSFPDGITGAFDTLARIVPPDAERTLFGITIPREDGKIEYRAAVNELYSGEGEKYGCPVYTIPRGKYFTETLEDWRNNVSAIGETFRKLGDSRPDTGFPCIEWYKGNDAMHIEDVMCMVKIK